MFLFLFRKNRNCPIYEFYAEPYHNPICRYIIFLLVSGKKGKVMERRLLKDFHIGIVEGLVQEMNQNNEPKNIFGQLAKVIGRRTTSKKKDWNKLVRKSSVKVDPIGSAQGMENSIAKRQSLRKHILANVKQLQNLDDTMLLGKKIKIGIIFKQIYYVHIQCGKLR